MRKSGLLAAFVMCACLAGIAAAQSPMEGPLSDPVGVPMTKAKPKLSKLAHSKRKNAHRETPHASSAYEAPVGTAQPIIHAGHDAPADPLSLGMKWNGSNDNARDTRVQNYDGNAAGTGAEVGLKLHF